MIRKKRRPCTTELYLGTHADRPPARKRLPLRSAVLHCPSAALEASLCRGGGQMLLYKCATASWKRDFRAGVCSCLGSWAAPATQGRGKVRIERYRLRAGPGCSRRWRLHSGAGLAALCRSGQSTTRAQPNFAGTVGWADRQSCSVLERRLRHQRTLLGRTVRAAHAV